jgi:hypothetical protein
MRPISLGVSCGDAMIDGQYEERENFELASRTIVSRNSLMTIMTCSGTDTCITCSLLLSFHLSMSRTKAAKPLPKFEVGELIHSTLSVSSRIRRIPR